MIGINSLVAEHHELPLTKIMIKGYHQPLPYWDHYTQYIIMIMSEYKGYGNKFLRRSIKSLTWTHSRNHSETRPLSLGRHYIMKTSQSMLHYFV